MCALVRMGLTSASMKNLHKNLQLHTSTINREGRNFSGRFRKNLCYKVFSL
jgi:hypothetical protein